MERVLAILFPKKERVSRDYIVEKRYVYVKIAALALAALTAWRDLTTVLWCIVPCVLFAVLHFHVFAYSTDGVPAVAGSDAAAAAAAAQRKNDASMPNYTALLILQAVPFTMGLFVHYGATVREYSGVLHRSFASVVTLLFTIADFIVLAVSARAALKRVVPISSKKKQ